MAIDFLNPGQRRINIGKARADLARNPQGGSLPLNNKEALEVSRASARDLVWGTIEKNLRNKKAKLQKQRASMTGPGLRSFDGGNRLHASEIDDEIEELTKRIFEAANGKPAKVSITQQREQQNSLAKLIAGLFAAQAQEGNVRSGTSQRVDSSQSSGGASSKASSAGERVLTDMDVDAIVKAFEPENNPRNSSGISAEAK